MYIIGIILFSILIIILVLAAVTRKSYIVVRKATISNSPQAIFAYIRQLGLQENYSKWVMTDPGKKITTRGTDGTVGFVYAWNGNKQAGEGEQEITRITEDKKLSTEVRFVRPFKGIAQTTMELTSLAPATQIEWTFSSAMPYPMNIMLLFINMEKMLGNDMEASLANLKKILDK